MAASNPASSMKARVAVSSVAMNHKPDRMEYDALYRSYTNQEIDPFDLVGIVATGQSFAPWAGEPRNAINWRCCQVVGVDLEKHADAALEVAQEQDFYRRYGFMGYTTMSHTPAAPRCRLLFVLDAPVDDREVCHWGALAIAEMWSPVSDLGSADRGRAFLGNPNATIELNGRLLPARTFLMLSRQRELMQKRKQEEVTQRRNNISGSGLSPNEHLQRWVDKIRQAPEGERNVTLNRCAFMIGRYVVGREGVDKRTAMALLIEAGIGAGLDAREAEVTVRLAVEKGGSVH